MSQTSNKTYKGKTEEGSKALILLTARATYMSLSKNSKDN